MKRLFQVCFYTKASSGPYISSIQIPTLIVNALNDPFLPPECFSFDIAKDHRFVYLETPERGGHVGFSLRKNGSWKEERALNLSTHLADRCLTDLSGLTPV